MDAVARDKLYGHGRVNQSEGSAKGKGKAREWDVELTEVDGNGLKRKLRRLDGSDAEEGSDGEHEPESEDSDGSSLSTAEGISSFDRREGAFPLDKESDGFRPIPPPAPPPPVPPQEVPTTSLTPVSETPPVASTSWPKTLHPILKRPQPARLHSSNTSEAHTLSFSPSLPATLSRTTSPASPSVLTSYAPELPITSFEARSPADTIPLPLPSPSSKETRRPLYPGLRRKSTVGDDKDVGVASGGTSSAGHMFDPTATIRSWKSSLTARKNPDKKRLAALGFEEELQRDYDFWASFGISLCNIGGLPGEPLHSLVQPLFFAELLTAITKVPCSASLRRCKPEEAACTPSRGHSRDFSCARSRQSWARWSRRGP